jgi:hypothetical protein
MGPELLDIRSGHRGIEPSANPLFRVIVWVGDDMLSSNPRLRQHRKMDGRQKSLFSPSLDPPTRSRLRAKPQSTTASSHAGLVINEPSSLWGQDKGSGEKILEAAWLLNRSAADSSGNKYFFARSCTKIATQILRGVTLKP